MKNDSMKRLLGLALLPVEAIPASALQTARFSLFDWMVVALAGSNEPLSKIIRELISAEGGAAHASLCGGGMAPARAAALVNGTISHALDYDDTHFAHVGHPSVAIMPAALAIAEERGLTGDAVAAAFLLGAEASVRIGMILGAVHYNRGFHQTATAGAFGATVAAARLLGLDEARMRTALSLVSTRASGLKSQFGTMGKSYNAGIAAANGVEAAKLAAAGFISADDGLAGPQGFIDTHSDGPDFAKAWLAPAPETFLFEDVKYKFHACCHGTHAMIEALMAARTAAKLSDADVRTIKLRVSPRWLKVCDIKAPRTGLEVKFSYAWLAGMILCGIDTASEASYADSLCSDTALASFARRVEVAGDAAVTDTATVGTIEMASGNEIPIAHDIAGRLAPDVVEEGLRRKAAGMLGKPQAERIWKAVNGKGVAASELGHLLRNAA
jgi:2-methylcitrate dehydratase PrpD